MHHRTIWALTCGAALLASACDSGTDKPKPEPAGKVADAPRAEKAPPPAEPAPAALPREAGPGQLDAEIVRAAASVQGVQKLKVEVEPDGRVRYLSLYHNDAAALPEPVTRQVEAQFPGGKILQYESEFVAEHGRLFEVEVETKDQQKCEFSAKPDGAIVYHECHIDPKALPEAVRAAAEKALPGATIKEAEKKTYTGAGDEYELELELAGRGHELYFKPDGTLFRHELVIPAEIEIAVP